MKAPSPGELVGKGLTADVFAWEKGRVLKLSHGWMPREKIESEFHITRAVHKTGFPCPAVFELIEHDGRLGIVFERIDGISMFQTVQNKPWRLRPSAFQLAELHARMHALTAPPELPAQRLQFERWIEASKDLSATEFQAARENLSQVQPGDTLCHGDFHPQNVLYSRQGAIIIDWSTGTSGDPVADVARSSSLILGAEIPPGTPFHMRMIIHVFRSLVNKLYLRRYFQLCPGSPELLARYAPLQAAALSAWRSLRVN